jgi:precorrin-4/cobalt-precorrin-4 C11-methyltransferase
VTAGRVLFVGCGPGAADLLTVRAVRALQTADIVIWNASLLAREDLRAIVGADAEILAWPPATQADIIGAFERAVAHDLRVVRLKGGDPTLFGELEPELSAVRELGLACEIVPGVTAPAAAAAALGAELGTRGMPVLLVHASDLAEPQIEPALAIYGVGRDPHALQRDLTERGVAASAPCRVAIELSRRAETVVECRLDDLAETIGDLGLGMLTLVLASISAAAESTLAP